MRVRSQAPARRLSGSVLAAIAAAATPAQAQEINDEEDRLQRPHEIIVTAQKRSESLQDVPISVTTFSAEQLERLRVTETAEFLEQVVNVTFSKTGNNDTNTSIRGISSNLGGITDPVGVTIDGLTLVTIDTSVVLSTGSYDLERIEVLRGPQGTLNGGNAVAGAINFISVKPTTDGVGGQITVDYGRFDRLFTSGAINLPLDESTAMRVFAYRDRSDGAVRNIGPAGGGSNHEFVGGRASLRYSPIGTGLTVDASLSHEDRRAGFDTQLPIDVYFSESRRQERIARVAELGGNYFDSDFITKVGNNGGNIRADVADRNDSKIWIGTIAAEYDFGDVTGRLAYGHYDFWNVEREDDDKSEFPLGRADFLINAHSNSVEAQLTSSHGGPINWLVGAAYLNEHQSSLYTFSAGDGVTLNSFTLAEQSLSTRQLERIGGYGTLFWRVTDKLKLSGGLRVSHERLSYEDLFTEDASFLASSPLVSSRTDVLPRLTLNYEPNDSLTAYFQYAQGIRSGFANDERVVAVGAGEKEVRPEKLTNYEIGLKGQLLGGMLSGSVALFHSDYRDVQVPAEVEVTDTQVVGYTINGGSAYIRGFEAELTARPFERLVLRGSLGHVDTNIKEINDFGTILRDVDLPLVRPWSATAAFEYQVPISSEATTTFNGSMVWRDRMYESIGDAEADLNNEYISVDFSASVNYQSVTVTAYIENVFDEKYWLANETGFSHRGTFVDFLPRTWGVRVMKEF